MNIIENTDEEILEHAHTMWADLVKYSNEGNYGAFTRNLNTRMKETTVLSPETFHHLFKWVLMKSRWVSSSRVAI